MPEKMLIVGCGRATHLHNSKALTSNYITHSHRASKEEGTYTMDIDHHMFPDIVGDISDQGFSGTRTERFLGINFENVPGIVFADGHIAHTCKNVDDLLIPGGVLLLRVGGSISPNGQAFVSGDVIKKNAIKYFTENYKYLDIGEKSIQHDETSEEYFVSEEELKIFDVLGYINPKDVSVEKYEYKKFDSWHVLKKPKDD